MKRSLPILLTSGLLFASASTSVAMPTSTEPNRSSFVLTQRGPAKRPANHILTWADAHKAHLQQKYGISTIQQHQHQRRAAGISLTNLEYDSTWLATVQGGTPAKPFNVVLDTGSSDFWLSSNSYSPSSSSSFTNTSTPFDIQYGSGSVSGYVSKDNFSLAGTKVNSLTFAVAQSVSKGLFDSHIDGIMGMGFQKLASDGAHPLWQAANIDTFSFYLERRLAFSGTNGNDEAYGGIFTLGGTNSSLYTGDISYNNVIEQLYWLVSLGGLEANHSPVDLSGLNRAAIDTGTTLIGGPDDVIEHFYSKIPGAKSTGNGYYSYPCSQSVNASLTFGNKQYTINDLDFAAGTLDSSGTTCLGALFGLGSTSSDDLQWIIGDAFLKNVYTIFTTANNQARVGFASLANGLNSGTQSKTVQGTSSSSSSSYSSPVASFPSLLFFVTSSIGLSWLVPLFLF